MSFSFQRLGLYTVLLGVGCGVGFAGHYYLAQEAGPEQSAGNSSGTVSAALQTPLETAVQAAVPLVPAQSDPNFIAEAVEKIGPAVVRIDAARPVTDELSGAFQHPLFKRFFGDDMPPPSSLPERIEQGTGSGFILDANGKIITNAHVVDGATEVTVTLKDGRTFEGEVIGTDSVTDVAVIKIEATDLPKVMLGSTEDLVPGQWAIAIGNPLGLDNTVTESVPIT
ncbi:MAG: serine protease, partial [Leptolyngbya sp. SIO4C5]|nr:serine protease [Leptolyngbya sp. SIO4C5]